MRYLIILLMFFAASAGIAKEEASPAAASGADQAGVKEEYTAEQEALDRLFQVPDRNKVLGVLAELLEMLEKRDIAAMDYGFYISKMQGFTADEYLEANTKLDRKFFDKAVELMTYLQKNRDLRGQLKVAKREKSVEYSKLAEGFQLVKKHLKKLHDKPIDASEALVKKQQKARQKIIDDLNEIIEKQRKEALRKAKEEERLRRRQER